MNSSALSYALGALIVASLPRPSFAADIVRPPSESAPVRLARLNPTTVAGRVTVIDGRTLWFPGTGQKVRLDGIDTCELPQWAFDPKRHGDSLVLKPTPCGALSKAWLKRLIGDSEVACRISSYSVDGAFSGKCIVDARDLAVGMLRVGWARVKEPASVNYLRWQHYAMSARYGMWATYVMDPDEWRATAVDRTLARRPIADFNLLSDRMHEISPPFLDAKELPARSDR